MIEHQVTQLKESIRFIAVLTHIINRSLATDLFPGKLKITKLIVFIPIFKFSDLCQLKNCCPISLFPVLSRLLEKIIYDKLISYLNTNNILYKYQYTF